MVAAGRNAPCPCGSGKKQKRCCLAKARSSKATTGEAFRQMLQLRLPAGARRSADENLQALRSALLSSTALDEGLSPLVAMLVASLDHLAKYPADQERRVELEHVLSADVAGLLGAALLIRVATEAEVPTDATPEEARDDPTDDEQLLSVLREYLAALQPGPFALIPQPLPAAIRTADVDTLAATAVQWLQSGHAVNLGDREDSAPAILTKFLMDASLVSSRAPPPQVALGLLATIRAHQLDYQKARDLAEHALLLTTRDDSPLGRRTAWLNFADAYLRCGQAFQALIGWCVATRIAAESCPARARFREHSFAVRLWRALRRWDVAALAAEKARQTADALYAPEEDLARLGDTLAFIELGALSEAKGEIDQEAIEDLAERLVAAVVRERDSAGQPWVPAIALAQVRALARRDARPIAADTNAADLAGLPSGGLRDLCELLEETSPTLEGISNVLGTGGMARSVDDLGTDLTAASVLAPRLLESSMGGSNADVEAGIAGVELLADHTIPPLGVSNRAAVAERNRALVHLQAAELAAVMSGEPEALGLALGLRSRATESEQVRRFLASPTTVIGEVRDYLQEKEATLFAFAMGETDRLVRISVSGSSEASVEVEVGFDADRCRAWLRQYPFAYAALARTGSDEASRFLETLRGLELSSRLEPSGSRRAVALLPTGMLRGIPPNLWGSGDDLTGDGAPRAMVPSLTWLLSCRRSPVAAAPLRVAAWVLSPAAGMSTLAFLESGMQEAVDSLGLAVTSSNTLPSQVAHANVLLLGGHGGLHVGDQFFRALVDDQGNHLSPIDTAERLRGIEVVVLLVCSGGRFDAAPFSNRSVGLTAALLRAGVRAVVSSPWPLAVDTAKNWLKAFVGGAAPGVDVATACWNANQRVRDRFAGPQDYLAMNVYGDPWFPFERLQSTENGGGQ